MNKFKKLVFSSLAAGVLALSALPAQASLILTLTSGSNTVTVNGTNAVNYFGALGTDWTFNNTTGLDTSTPNLADVFLTTINLDHTTSGTSTLTIRFTDTGLTGPVGTNTTGRTSVGGTTQGSVQFNTYFNSVLVSSNGVFNPNSYSNDTYFSGLDTSSPYSVTNEIIITQTGAGTTQATMETTIPEPATLGLLGLGLLGLGFARSRKSV